MGVEGLLLRLSSLMVVKAGRVAAGVTSHLKTVEA